MLLLLKKNMYEHEMMWTSLYLIEKGETFVIKHDSEIREKWKVVHLPVIKYK